MHLSDDRIRQLSERITAIYSELVEATKRAAPKSDVEHLASRVEECDKRSNDVFAFKTESAPQLRYCVSTLTDLAERTTKSDVAVARLDELILDKASKFSLQSLQAWLDKSLPKETADAKFSEIQKQFDEMQQRLKKTIKIRI